MRPLLFIILITTSYMVSGQELPVNETNNKVEYSDVVSVPNSSADNLYSRLLDWMQLYYKVSEVDLSLPDKHLLSHKSGIPFKFDVNKRIYMVGFLIYNLTFEVKDGRFKYTITDFAIADSPDDMDKVAEFKSQVRHLNAG